jgi:outer membrane protein OmpA-like peptidoglycan-associated protein
MTAKAIPLVCSALLVGGGFGCSRDGRAHAVADPDSAHAEVHVDTRGNDDAYDSSKLSRTGVTIDDEITRACKVKPTESFFAFDSASIDERTADALTLVADCVRTGALAGKELELVGHTDPVGSDEYNKELGISRAEAVARYLRDYGVPTTQIEVASVGEAQASPDAADWPLDRRVDIRIKSTLASR